MYKIIDRIIGVDHKIIFRNDFKGGNYREMQSYIGQENYRSGHKDNYKSDYRDNCRDNYRDNYRNDYRDNYRIDYRDDN